MYDGHPVFSADVLLRYRAQRAAMTQKAADMEGEWKKGMFLEEGAEKMHIKSQSLT